MTRKPAAAVGVTIALLLFAVVVPLVAQQQLQPAVIAVVDNDRVFAESVPGQQAAERIQASYAEWQDQVAQLEQEISDLRTQRQQATGVEQQQAIDTEIERKTVQLQRLTDDANREFTRSRDAVLAELEGVLTPAVAQVAAQQGITAVFNAQTPGLIHFDATTDITDELIQVLNAQAPGGSR